MGVADVHDNVPALGEEAALRLEVLLHRPVKVEMVLAQVREDEDREARAVETPFCRRDRRRFHHAHVVAGSDHLAEQALQVDRLGRVEGRRADLVSDAALDTAEQPRVSSCRLEDRPEQKRGRRLSARAGDTDDLELAGRIAEELDGGPRHRLAHARDDELKRVDLEPALDDERGGSCRKRCPGEVVPVRLRTRNAEEERARHDLVGVVCELADLEGSAPNDLGRAERGDEPLQLHLASGV